MLRVRVTCGLSGLKLITQFEIMASTVASGTGMCSISPSRKEIDLFRPLLGFRVRFRARV